MRFHPFSSLLAATLLFACKGIPETDPRWDRKELEVLVEVDPLISALLRQADELPALEAVVSDAVFGLADVGLRFYPVPSASYAENQAHPEFLLTVHIQDVDAFLQHRTKGGTTEEGELDRMRCTAVATLTRRRADGPPLIVGKAVGFGQAKAEEASASLSTMREFELRSGDRYSSPLRLGSDELRASIEEAVSAALRSLVEPIDREFTAGQGPG